MKTIHHVLDVDAGTADMWAALTSATGLSGWWSRRVSVEGAGAGADIRFVFDGDFNPNMQVVEAEPGQRLVWRCVDGHDNWRDNTFTSS